MPLSRSVLQGGKTVASSSRVFILLPRRRSYASQPTPPPPTSFPPRSRRRTEPSPPSPQPIVQQQPQEQQQPFPTTVLEEEPSLEPSPSQATSPSPTSSSSTESQPEPSSTSLPTSSPEIAFPPSVNIGSNRYQGYKPQPPEPPLRYPPIDQLDPWYKQNYGRAFVGSVIATIIFSKWYWDDPEDYARRLAEITKAHTTQLDADIVFIQDTFEKLIEMEKRERIKEDKEMEKRGRWMEKKKRELEALGIDLGELEGEMGLGQGGGGREGNRWRA